jgi:hypothetical protein
MTTPFDEIPDEFRQAAEHVASYLVNARGGALFLSGADLRLLIEWLEADVPVPAILASIDQVAAKRRSKRVRTRLSLNGCKGTLNKILYGKNAPKTEIIEDTGQLTLAGALRQWSIDIRTGLTEDDLFHVERRRFANQLQDLSNTAATRESVAEQVIGWINGFQDTAWYQYGIHQTEWFEEAEIELQNLRRILTGARWVEAVEEVARDRLRQLFPLIQAQHLWNTLNGVHT